MTSPRPAIFTFEFANTPIAVSIASTAEQALNRLRRGYEPYLAEQNNKAPTITITLFTNDSGYCLEAPWGSLSIPVDSAHPDEATRQLEARLEQAMLRGLCFAQASLDCFHAAAVAFGEKCIVLAGPPFAGKSTLALALCAAGGRLITDDILLAQNGLAWPLRRRMAFRSAPNLFPLEPFADPNTRLGKDDASFTAFVDARYLAENNHPVPITDILLLLPFQPETHLEPLEPFAGLTGLSKFTFLPLDTETAGMRLLRYTGDFKNARWWHCAPGRPWDAAQRIVQQLHCAETNLHIAAEAEEPV